ncbi:MAG: glutamate--tRNA ligase [Candidatus Yanofskybacteria bacterium]|nr:glutamate--tRNA ligase [Candidatus Yanofskybacteria bacterium]
MDKVKVRIAPSPTGNLHVGTAQSALYNWLFARKNGGEFYLRIEDTDKERSTKEYEHGILDALTWLGLKWDGEVVRQSERMDKYKAALEKLLAEGKAFYCHHAKDELEEERKEQEAKKEPPRHVCDHKDSEKGKTEGGIIRLATHDSNTLFKDEIRGVIVFKDALFGDFSIAKSLDEPLYNLAVVVDDIDMEISHVIRGEDHISNTPKQLLIYEALLEGPPPIFAHLPLILAPDRSKLSKRHGAVAVVDYKKDYLPEALLNFLGSMSYTFSKEILTREEMAEEFELSKVHKSGAVFDVKKLNWLNSQYIKQLNNLTIKQLTNLPEIPDAAIPLITERLEKLTDVGNFDYFWKEPNYDSNLLDWKGFSREEIKNSLEQVRITIEYWDWADKSALRLLLDDLGKKLGDPAKSSNDRGASRGLVYWPFRVALTGKEKSPDPVDVAVVLGKDVVLERVDVAIEKLT